MFCRNCARQIADQAVVCVGCNAPPWAGRNYCQNCATQTHPMAEVCHFCGVQLAGGGYTSGYTGGYGSSYPAPYAGAYPMSVSPYTKTTAGLLGIFLGGFGAHRFYLGYNAIGIAQLILCLLGIVTFFTTTMVAGIWGFVEGVLILADQIPTDAQGRRLLG
jgi:TM2 domain-containing membrane protein YozV